MELEQRLQRFIDGDGTHDDILGALVPLLHQKSDLEHMFDIDGRIVASFPFFFRNGKAVEFVTEQMTVLPSGTIVHGIYTIESPLEHSPCFFRYRVSVLDKQYVLCLLKPSLWEQEYEEAFLREQTISQVLSNAPTRCIHACTISMIPFLVYDAPQGGTIKDFLLRQPIPEVAVLRRIGLQMCTAVCSLHQVMMSHFGIRMDVFGISKMGLFLREFGVEERLISNTKEVQRMRYYAPEQLVDGYLDARTDVYALGILLYRLYNGQFPFPDKSNDLAAWHQSGDRQQIPFLDSVHLDVQEVILKSIHPEPMLRYDSACQLKEAFCHATSKIGWFTFDRYLLPKIQNRISLNHLYCDGALIDWNGSVEEEFGDVFPTWRIHNGMILLSIDPYVRGEHPIAEVQDLQKEPFSYSKFKALYENGHQEECLQQCAILEQNQDHILLLVYLYSSLFSNPKKTEELLSVAMTTMKDFKTLLETAVFSCWHRMDEVTTRKILQQMETVCSDPQEQCTLAQSYLSLLNDEEASSRLLQQYILSCSDSSIEEQIGYLSQVAICFGQRPELVRWAIRLEEDCDVHHYLLLSEVWSLLAVPKRAQKMKQKRTEMLRLSVQQLLQKFTTYSVPLPKDIPTEIDSIVVFLEEGERLVNLAVRKARLETIISNKGIPMNIDNMPLEEQSILDAELYCSSFVQEEQIQEQSQIEAEIDIEAQIEQVESSALEVAEPVHEEIEEIIDSKLSSITLQLFVLWGFVFAMGMTLWYSCS